MTMAAKTKRTKTVPSSVCRVNKTRDFTIMSNCHLNSKNLSLKAIGLLCKILSLRDDWDYSISGLSSICKEKETAIKAALDELKEWGYLVVTKLMPNETESGRIEYVYDFYEVSEIDKPDAEQGNDKQPIKKGSTPKAKADATTTPQKQGVEKQGIENLPLEILPLEIQAVENQRQLKTNNKKLNNKILNKNQSINQSACKDNKQVRASKSSEDRLNDRRSREFKAYTDVVKQNIDFFDFSDWLGNEDEAEEIVQMIVRQICSSAPYERICNQQFPREVVKSAMLKVDNTVLTNAIEQISHADSIQNYEKYLISTLFNEANGKTFKENAESRWADYAVKRDFGHFNA